MITKTSQAPLPTAQRINRFSYAIRNIVAEARKVASQVPINDQRASDKEVTGAFRSKSGLKAQLETEWENLAKANYAKARELATKALASAK